MTPPSYDLGEVFTKGTIAAYVEKKGMLTVSSRLDVTMMMMMMMLAFLIIKIGFVPLIEGLCALMYFGFEMQDPGPTCEGKPPGKPESAGQDTRDHAHLDASIQEETSDQELNKTGHKTASRTPAVSSMLQRTVLKFVFVFFSIYFSKKSV